MYVDLRFSFLLTNIFNAPITKIPNSFRPSPIKDKTENPQKSRRHAPKSLNRVGMLTHSFIFMKKIIVTLLLAFCAIQFVSIQASVEDKSAGKAIAAKILMQQNAVPASLLNMDQSQFLNLTPKKIKEITGEKLSLKQTIALKAMQKSIKKEMKAEGAAEGPKSQIVALLLCFFLGGLGIHRLYLGYSNWWLQLITLGGCGIWALIDLIRIITGDMKPADGSAYDPAL